MSRVGVRHARTQREQRSWGVNFTLVRNPGLENWWDASVDLWWWCARLTCRCKPAQAAA